ncbi:hypothetical protein OEZ85_007925 [Tetradesmus obliquus]|uniref:Uncharacterized protein n=2 Tax=Tetradesmus obliquus TaxID=3088 RepID=A0A383VQ59_TETOB|nr:hypothetical protein OEZ85_007925 [Tetradesmus obliquus]|eukprot:jgi/Sobl393_1/11615/SZX67033.1
MPFFRSDSKKAPSEPHTTSSSFYPNVDPLQDSALGPGSSAHAGWGHTASHADTAAAYPHVPNLAEPSAPPLPNSEFEQYGIINERHLYPKAHQQQPAAGNGRPAQALVATPKIEAQPWVKDLWKHLAAKTVGVARVDLRRPTFPWPEDYDAGNILFRRGGSRPEARRGRGRPRKEQPPLVGYVADYDGSYYPQQQQPAYGYPAVGQQQQRQQPYRQQPTGARLKVMRCVQLKAPDSKRPLLDFGLGVGVDLDRQELHGVARLKVADLVSLKLLPQPLLKLGGAWPLPGTSGMALRLKYEVPLMHLGEFWQPPARLMVRLDNDVGTGVHLTPTGVEFDERRLTLGKSTEVRAGATLRFPRTLPIDRDDPDAFKLQVHRLSLKTLW